MGQSLVAGLLRASFARPDELAIAELDPERRVVLQHELPGVQIVETVVSADAALLAVKPQAFEGAARAVASVGIHRVLSIMAGVRTGAVEACLAPGARVVRAMPNTPALLGAGISAIAPGAHATVDDMSWAREVLSAVGLVEELPEYSLDAVTAVSGSGPAYIFMIAEAMIDAGVLAGLTHDVARRLVTHTIAGAGRMLVETGSDPASLREGVTSPGGTTAAALAVLEGRAIRSTFLDAITAATERSRELGN
jgi:pyrroline-5-carboxylate reductase